MFKKDKMGKWETIYSLTNKDSKSIQNFVILKKEKKDYNFYGFLS